MSIPPEPRDAFRKQVSSDAAGAVPLVHGVMRYTRFVKRSKRVLVVLISVLLLALLVLPIVNRDQAGVRIAMTLTEETKNERPIMKNPRFSGVDEEGQPYLVTADFAMQKTPDEVFLQKVQADLTMKDETWLLVRANEGTLDSVKREMLLDGDVNLFHDNGYEFKTDKMKVYMAEGRSETLTPVTGNAAMGQIASMRFSAYERGQRLLFDGQVRMTIYPNRTQ